MARMNRNQALGNSFLFHIPGFGEANYFVQTVELPSLSMVGVETPFPTVWNERSIEPHRVWTIELRVPD